jgi:DNA-binding LacI/PurR family transcriptional regulator
MPATIHDVAKRAGVGIGTVSSVLNNSRPVLEATRQKVLSAIAELDFMPNLMGRRLSKGKTQTVAVIIPFFTGLSQGERFRGVMSVIAASDYEINLFSFVTVSQRDKILQKALHHGQVDGLLIFSINPTESDLRRISRENLPTVLVEVDNPHLSRIVRDDVAAARKATQHLVDLGHRKIGYLGDYLDDPFGFPFSRHRYLGYCQALETAGIPIRPAYQRQGGCSREEGRQMALELLSLPDPPTAIFAYSDVHALGIIEAAGDLNLNVPGGLSIVGYDDIAPADFVRLTTIRQQLFESGWQGINLLLKLMAKPDTPPIKLELPTELIVRQTTAPPKR